MTRSLCALEIPPGGLSGSFVTGKYSGIPGNQPKLYANCLAIWEGGVIPWTAPALGRVSIGTNATMGAAVIREVVIGRDIYTVAYGLGEAVSAICASATFDADGQTITARVVELSINLAEPSSLALHYGTLPGYRPLTSRNWIGLWRGEASPYDAPEPLARVEIAQDVNEDDVVIDGIALSPLSSYTLAYFLGPEPTTAAALLTFQVA
jgi:hypothetical protein